MTIGGRLSRLAPMLVAVAAVALTALSGAVLLWLGGFDPADAAGALLRGAFGSPGVFLSITLVRSVPLILTGLAVALAFQAGVWNIGAEGQLYAGAVSATFVGLAFGHLPGPVLVPIVLASSVLAGSVWALVPAWMRVRLGVGEVITTILMNFVGIHFAALMVHGPMQESRGVFPQSDALPESARLPLLTPEGRLHVGLLIGLGLSGLLLWVLRRTAVGYRIRATGAAPEAARIAGRIDTGRTIFVAFLVSGAIAGLAGGVEVSGVTFALYEGLSPGWGYTAIAVALLAGLHPVGVVLTGVLFGALQAGAGAMQREAGIPAAWVGVVEALVILAVLGLDRVRRERSRG